MKKVAVLGSTGSIGTQTLDVIRENPDRLKVYSLVAFSNREKLNWQVAEFAPKYSALIAERGVDCLIEAVKECDIAVVATRGITALRCVLYCLENGIDVALANKEVLVCAGSLVMSKVGDAKLIPIDSEHSAIMQCLQGRKKQDVNKILLTASGGPFFETPFAEMHKIRAKDALRHPNWDMGEKITIDCATMTNKALEVIEAHWLFGVPYEKIQIVVHRQSVVHSMVEMKSGSVIAQMASPDMKLPIAIALLGGGVEVKKLDFEKLLTLTFQQCDFTKFPCAKLAYELESYPPLCCTVMNAANDVCVDNFVCGKLSFEKFHDVIMKTVNNFAEEVKSLPITADNVEAWDTIARTYAKQVIKEGI